MKGFAGTRISLTTKVLILIAIPLVFVLSAAFMLLDAINRMDEQALLAEQSQEITDTTNSLLKDLFIIGQEYNLETLYQKGELETVEISEIPLIVKVSRDFKKLSHLTKDLPREHKIVKTIRENYRIALQAMVKRQQEYIVNNNPDFSGMIHYGRAVATEELVDLPKASRFKNKRAREREVKYRQSVKSNLVNLVVLSFITTMIVLFAIINILTRPLASLRNNTLKRISDDQSVAQLAGDNEIADVDRAFAGLVEAVNDANEKEKAILENVNDIICTIDGAGKFATVNEASEDILGYSPEDLIGKYYLDYILSEEAQKISQSVDAVVDGHGAQKFEGKMIKSDGETIDLLWSCYWSDADRSLYLILYDNSHVKQAERLRQEVISMVTHDLRSPLAGISLAYDFLKSQDSFQEDQELSRLVKQAASACHLMNCLITDLLDVEKIRSGQMQLMPAEVKVSHLFQKCKQLLQSTPETDNLQLEIGDNRSTLVVDSDSMVKVLTSLVASAAKYCEENKKIKLDAQDMEGMLELSISYDGRNIPPVMLSSMFEHYQKLDYSTDHYPGVSGLALTLCKTIVEEQGGEIWAENYASGSAYKISIPLRPLVA